ncbi:MAG: helix-turn-helix domain-containing protein [Mariprofundaceae bacterium]|nr:helix-turn-helix domain-containing protein [Mariprofundaceae bacterium]
MKRNKTKNDAPIRQQAERLGAWICAARKQRGLTQAQLAGQVGITIPTLRKLESGDGSVSLHTFLSTLAVLQIEDAVLCTGQPYIHSPLPEITSGNKHALAKRLQLQGIHPRDAENAAWLLSLSPCQRIQLLIDQEKEQRLCGIARP